MVRAVAVMLGILAGVIVLAEVSLLGLLWARGSLTSQSLARVRVALSGQPAESAAKPQQPAAGTAPSEEQIRELRVRRILELEARENELTLLKRMTTDTANRLISDRQAFDELKESFRNELQQLQEQTTSAATEQTRTVLLAMPPEAAVERLMGLTVPEGVDLLRGLPEKSIARILQGFQGDPRTAGHGQKLFEGIYRGDPNRQIIGDTLDQLNQTPAAAKGAG